MLHGLQRVPFFLRCAAPVPGSDQRMPPYPKGRQHLQGNGEGSLKKLGQEIIKGGKWVFCPCQYKNSQKIHFGQCTKKICDIVYA